MQKYLAYPVPFRVERGAGHLYRIVNVGPEIVHGVALTLHGGGVMGASAPSTLRPGEVLEVAVAGRNLARSAIMVVRWFRPDGAEYLWRISF
jgi:hypothetical protein